MLLGIGERMLSNGEPKKSSGDLNLINPLDLHLNPEPGLGGTPFQADKDSQDQWTRRTLSSSEESESEDAFSKETSLDDDLNPTKDSDRFLFQKSLNPFSKEISPNKEPVVVRQIG